MSRQTVQPTDATPWLAQWTAASPDLSSTTADTAPVELVVPPGTDFIRLGLSQSLNGILGIWHLLAVDYRALEDELEPTVVYSFEFISNDIVTDRQTHFNDGGGRFIHHLTVPPVGDLIFDIRSIPRRLRNRSIWYLALVLDIGGTYYLHDYWTWSERPS